MGAVTAEDDYASRLKNAVNARDDGELEEAAAQLDTMLAEFPGDADITLEYARTVSRMNDSRRADGPLEAAMSLHPGNFELRAMWADMPLFDCDWPELLRRGDILRGKFSAELSSYHLIHELLALRESFLWEDAAALVEAHWQQFTMSSRTFPHAIDALTSAVKIDRLEALVNEASLAAWRELPAEAEGNLRLRISMMRRNETLVRETGVRLISLGQNCLPFQLPRRWGLNTAPHDLETLLPFDQGAFHTDTAAAAIATDFSAYDDEASYAPAFNRVTRGYTLAHRPSGVPFYHWRGPYWLDDYRRRFFAHWQRMVANWRLRHREGKRLFIFSLVGAGDLGRLIELAELRLLGPNAHLLIVDVQKHLAHCPVHPQVTYLLNPYPDDYDWISVPHQNSAAGILFETRIAEAIATLVAKLGNALPGVLHGVESNRTQRRMLDAAVAANSRGDRQGCAAILESLRAWLPDDPALALADAQSLIRAGKYGESDIRLTGAIANFPMDFALRRFWSERPLHMDHNWDEAIRRVQMVRKLFPNPGSAEFLHCLQTELILLRDAMRWEEAKALIQDNWMICTNESGLFCETLSFLSRIFANGLTKRLITEATEQAKSEVPTIVFETALIRVKVAEETQPIIEAGGIRLISLGGTSMTFQVLGRWGCQGGEADPNLVTPFDMGTFSADAVANAIETDFRSFDDREEFITVPSGSGGWMLQHQPSGTNFLNERGVYWLNNRAERFFHRWDRLVEHWRYRKGFGRRLFVFLALRQESLDKLVRAAEMHLLGPDSFLVVIDARPEPPPFSSSSSNRVTYFRVTLPNGYRYDDMLSFNLPDGVRFEDLLLQPIVARMISAQWLTRKS